MNYKQHMHPTVSKGEIELFKALSKANLATGMVTQDPVVLKFTLPDFCWRQLKKAAYLDGVQIHNKTKVGRRDEEINDFLEQRDWQIKNPL